MGLEFRHKFFHGHDIFALIGPAGATEWRGTDPIKVHLHYGSDPWPLAAEDIADGAIPDDGCKCDYVRGGRCWIDPCSIQPEEELAFISGDFERAREVLSAYYDSHLASRKVGGC